MKTLKKTKKIFDDEGFMISGDAVGIIDPDNVTRGLYFDGRVAEDFKLITGTWVQASMMRLDFLPKLKGIAQDIVICGEGRDGIGLLIFVASVRGFAGDSKGDVVVVDMELKDEVKALLNALASSAEGSSKRIARALLMAEPPSIGEGKITAKGKCEY